MSWKIVPAVTELCRPHPAHWNNQRRTGHDFAWPHFGHRKPSGHRSWIKYARQASSVLKRASNSRWVRG
jgi:hypothetical protein